MFERVTTWVMLASGLLTMTMLYAAIDPVAATTLMLGEPVTGGAGEIIVRNWGLLVGGVGLLLLVGAVNRSLRRLALMVAVVSKAAFVGLVLIQGGAHASTAAFALALDSVVVVLFAAYLVARRATASP